MRTLERSAKTDTKGMIVILILYAIGALSVPYKDAAGWFGGSDTAVFLCGFVCKTVCAVLPFYLIREFGLSGELKFTKRFLRGLLFSLPAVLIAVDNFPIIPQITGYMSINADFAEVICLFLFCLSIGILEESIFRGCVFPLLAYRFKRDKKGLFWAVVVSSATFGGMHLLNLFGGFSPLVFLQVGYSFLLGLALSFCFLLTGNLFIPIIVHTIFDFGGFLSDYYGIGTLWTTENVIFTAVFSAISAGVMIFIFIKENFADVYEIWGLNEKPPIENQTK